MNILIQLLYIKSLILGYIGKMLPLLIRLIFYQIFNPFFQSRKIKVNPVIKTGKKMPHITHRIPNLFFSFFQGFHIRLGGLKNEKQQARLLRHNAIRSIQIPFMRFQRRQNRLGKVRHGPSAADDANVSRVLHQDKNEVGSQDCCGQDWQCQLSFAKT